MRRAVLLAAALAAALPQPAAAAVQLRGLDLSAHPQVRATVVASRPSSAAPRLAENESRPAGFGAVNLGAGPSIVLVLDRSRSMAGAPLRNAIAAARAFVRTKGADDRVAVVAFGTEAILLRGLSSSPREADAALRRVTLDPRAGTALNDALALAADLLAGEPAGKVVVLLTDGRDRGSAASLAAALDAARSGGVTVYPVALRGSGGVATLRAVARATGGRFDESAGSALVSAYRAIADELHRTWRVEWVSSAQPGERLRVRTWVPGLGEDVVAARVPGAAAGPTARDTGGASAPIDALVALAATALLTVAAFRVASFLRARRLRARLSPQRAPQETTSRRPLRDRVLGSSALVLATERRFGGSSFFRSLARLLERADVPFRPVEFAYVMAGGGGALAFLALLLGGGAFRLLLAAALGALAPYGLLRMKARRRVRAFEEQLPDLMMTLAGSLKAGHSFRSGLQTLVDEGADPARKEFARVLSEARLGRALEEALADAAERLGSADFRFVVSAVSVQRQVGGSLAEIFDMVADTVRQRQQFGRRVKALTAMGRMSAYTLIGMPIFLALALSALNPTYMSPLWGTGGGRMMVMVGGVMMVIGSLILRRIVAFKG